MIKRGFDWLLVLLFSPLILGVIFIVALFVLVFLGRPIFFCQERPGYLGKPFNMYKFRTMTEGCDEFGNILSDDKRLNFFGKMLRASSLDELPELINVLKGEMSLVGPRPLLMEYLSLYSEEQVRRHEVRPGITGWAQVNGRNSISWQDKFKLDVWYVDNSSFWLDIHIIGLTFIKVLKRQGINEDGKTTVDYFKGND